MRVLERLLPQIMQRWAIPAEGVIGHSDMAPGRKSDPGPRFDWQRLERQSLAAPRGTTAPTDTTLRSLAESRGYTAPTDEVTLLATTRLRYRPWATGPLHPDDLKAINLPQDLT